MDLQNEDIEIKLGLPMTAYFISASCGTTARVEQTGHLPRCDTPNYCFQVGFKETLMANFK